MDSIWNWKCIHSKTSTYNTNYFFLDSTDIKYENNKTIIRLPFLEKIYWIWVWTTTKEFVQTFEMFLPNHYTKKHEKEFLHRFLSLKVNPDAVTSSQFLLQHPFLNETCIGKTVFYDSKKHKMILYNQNWKKENCFGIQFLEQDYFFNEEKSQCGFLEFSNPCFKKKEIYFEGFIPKNILLQSIIWYCKENLEFL